MENTSNPESNIFEYLESRITPAMREEFELLAFQNSHDERIRSNEFGMFDKALNSKEITDEDRSHINGHTLATICLITEENEGSYQIRQSGKIRFATPIFDSAGEIINTRISLAEVMYRYPFLDESTELANDFTEDDIEVFRDMLDELIHAKQDGILSRLSDDYSSIDRETLNA